MNFFVFFALIFFPTISLFSRGSPYRCSLPWQQAAVCSLVNAGRRHTVLAYIYSFPCNAFSTAISCLTLIARCTSAEKEGTRPLLCCSTATPPLFYHPSPPCPGFADHFHHPFSLPPLKCPGATPARSILHRAGCAWYVRIRYSISCAELRCLRQSFFKRIEAYKSVYEVRPKVQKTLSRGLASGLFGFLCGKMVDSRST